MKVRLSALMAAGCLIAGAAAPALGDVQLRYNQWVPRSHHTQSQIMYPFFKRIADATQGRVKIVPTAASLGAPKAQMDMVRDGVVDVVFTTQSYTSSRFTLADIGLLPFAGDTGEAVSVAYWRVTQKMFSGKHDEYKGMKLLGLMTSGPGQVFNNKRPIRSVNDFKGLKLRVATAITADIAKAFGVVAVSVPAPKTYEILANGVADGTFSSIDGFRSWKLEKLLPYYTSIPGGLFFNTFYIAMNQKKWDAISEADKKAIDALGGEDFAKRAGRQWDIMDKKAEALIKRTGTKVIIADGKFLEEVKAELKFLETRWIEKANALGVDGAKAIEYMRAQAVEYENTKK